MVGRASRRAAFWLFAPLELSPYVSDELLVQALKPLDFTIRLIYQEE
jgi:hypothetical protein